MSRLALALAFLVIIGFSQADMLDTESLEPWETCALCHGFDGNSAMAKFPKLAGQKPAYLAKQIRDFQNGLRANDGGQMVNMVSGLSTSEIEQITQWFASQTPLPPEPSELSDAEIKRAEDIFYNGSATRQACISCHDTNNPTIPYIRGQHASYLKKQLNDFRNQHRSNDNEIMHSIAQQLSAEQIELLAAHIASLNKPGSQ